MITQANYRFGYAMHFLCPYGSNFITVIFAELIVQEAVQLLHEEGLHETESIGTCCTCEQYYA